MGQIEVGSKEWITDDRQLRRIIQPDASAGETDGFCQRFVLNL